MRHINLNTLIALILHTLVLTINPLHSQDYEYSVVVNTSLNVRSAPSINSDVIGKLHLFEKVRSELSHRKFIELQAELAQSDNSQHGFWLKIAYNNTIGYAYSVYMLPALRTNEQERRFEYTLLGRSYCFDQPNYDPNLNYYSINSNTGLFSETPIDVTFETNYRTRTFIEGTAYGRYPAVSVHPRTAKEGDYIIGLQKKGVTAIINDSLKMINLKNLSSTYSIVLNDRSYFIKPRVDTDGMYHIDFYHADSQSDCKVLDLNKFLHPDIFYKSIKDFLSPELVFAGDVNNDDNLDFIFMIDNLPEGCGRTWKHILLLSNSSCNYESREVNTNSLCN